MKTSVFCLVKTQEQADRIVARLLNTTFVAEDISFLVASGPKVQLCEKSLKECGCSEQHTKAPQGGATGALAGGIVGGSIGLLAGLGSLAIPGLGAFIAAGPIFAALTGSAIGGATGLLLGTLIGLGIPEETAFRFQEGLKKGYILLFVHARDSDQVELAELIMTELGAEEVTMSIEIDEGQRMLR